MEQEYQENAARIQSMQQHIIDKLKKQIENLTKDIEGNQMNIKKWKSREEETRAQIADTVYLRDKESEDIEEDKHDAIAKLNEFRYRLAAQTTIDEYKEKNRKVNDKMLEIHMENEKLRDRLRETNNALCRFERKADILQAKLKATEDQIERLTAENAEYKQLEMIRMLEIDNDVVDTSKSDNNQQVIDDEWIKRGKINYK